MQRAPLTLEIPSQVLISTTAVEPLPQEETHEVQPDPTQRLEKPIPTPQQSHVDEVVNPGSPERPPVSPIDPATIAEQLAALPAYRRPKPHEPTFIERPPPVPISVSENSDAIALRSAIALLQLQKEKSRKDLLTLQGVKQQALADPGGFLHSVTERKAQTRKNGKTEQSDVLTPTLQGRVESIAKASLPPRGASPKAEPTVEKKGEVPDSQERPETEAASRPDSPSSDEDDDKDKAGDQKFPPLPQPQNIFRMPPINWAKYHVAGETLEKMHEEQKVRPDLGQPGQLDRNGRARQHVMAAPYSPLTDVLPQEHRPIPPRKGLQKPT